MMLVILSFFAPPLPPPPPKAFAILSLRLTARPSGHPACRHRRRPSSSPSSRRRPAPFALGLVPFSAARKSPPLSVTSVSRSASPETRWARRRSPAERAGRAAAARLPSEHRSAVPPPRRPCRRARQPSLRPCRPRAGRPPRRRCRLARRGAPRCRHASPRLQRRPSRLPAARAGADVAEAPRPHRPAGGRRRRRLSRARLVDLGGFIGLVGPTSSDSSAGSSASSARPRRTRRRTRRRHGTAAGPAHRRCSPSRRRPPTVSPTPPRSSRRPRSGPDPVHHPLGEVPRPAWSRSRPPRPCPRPAAGRGARRSAVLSSGDWPNSFVPCARS